MTSRNIDVAAHSLSINLLTSLFPLIDRPIEALREEVLPIAKQALPEDIDDSVLIELSVFDACFNYLKKRYLASELATHIPKYLHASQYGLFGFLIATANDVEHMLKLIEKCGEELGFFNHASLRHGKNDVLQLTLPLQKSWRSLSCDTQSFLISSCCRLLEVGFGRNGLRKQLQLAVPERCVHTIQAEYAGLFYVLRCTDQLIKLTVPKELAKHGLPGSNERLHRVFLRELSEIQSERANQENVSGKVLKYLKSIENYKGISSISIASKFAISERTLNRKLASEHTSFKRLFVSVRNSKALTLLLKGESIEQVAYTVGFSDRSSFERSFKIWQGVTPAKFQGNYATLCSERPKHDVMDPKNIPSLPKVATRLLSELNSNDVNMDSLVNIITQDAMLSAKVLWVANSSFYGNLKIRSVKHAILSVFGTNKLKALALSLCAEQIFQIPHETFNYDEYHFCSYLTARAVEILYEKTGVDNNRVANFYFAGLLHNIGQIYICYCLPEKYAEIYSETIEEKSWDTLNRVQSMRLNINAIECSAMLAMAWDLPQDIKSILSNLAYSYNDSTKEEVLNTIIDLIHQTYRARRHKHHIDTLFASAEVVISSHLKSKSVAEGMVEIRTLVDAYSNHLV